MDQVIGDVIQSGSLADQLGKKQPLIKIDNGDLFIKREAHNMLNNIFSCTCSAMPSTMALKSRKTRLPKESLNKARLNC